MPNKIKIVLILVAIVAVFSVYELAQYVHAIANKTSVYQEGSPLPSPDDDPDHDGLSNQQEVIWGTDPFNPDSDGDSFKDGEEVASGHNPLVPGPNDLINQDNLTLQFSELTVAGLAEGSLQPDSPNYAQSLASITGSITDSAKYLFNKEVNGDELPEIDTSALSDTTYLKSIAPFTQLFGKLLSDQYAHIADNLNAIGENGFTDPTIKPYFSNQAIQYQEILNKGSNIKVPKNLKTAHTQFLSLALQMRDISDAVAKGDIDPIKASFALDALGNMYEKYLNVMQVYKTVLEIVDFDPSTVNIPKQ